MTKLHELFELGQSIWYDNIRRALIESGELKALVDQGVRGVTSNPTIFEKAIAGSADYDAAIAAMTREGRDAAAVYERLAVEDIRAAADLLRPVYDRAGGSDGFACLEVSPALASDTAESVAEARRLFALLDRPNVMIKIPATAAGIPAIQTLIGEGIPINVTLMFSMAHYEAVAEAYLAGLESLAAAGGNLARAASVASFFVSRVDGAVDAALAAAGNRQLQGKIAIANAKAVYERFREIYAGKRWQNLAVRGARPQRLLWASTGTKNPEYPDTYYVDALIGEETVNTVPPATLRAFMDQGTAAPTLAKAADAAAGQLAQLAALDIDLAALTEKLQRKGLDAFAASFQSLLDSVAAKQKKLTA